MVAYTLYYRAEVGDDKFYLSVRIVVFFMFTSTDEDEEDEEEDEELFVIEELALFTPFQDHQYV